jgi:type I restriction enzyme S subunit
MELKQGYKQTEVGAIPEDWEVTQLGKCLLASPDYGINAPAVPYSDELPVYIRITDIGEDGRFMPAKIVSVRDERSTNYYLGEGDIVLARTGASVGKSYLYDSSDGALVFAGFLIRLKPDESKLLPSFLASYLATEGFWRWVRLMSMRSGQPGINGREYAQLPVPLPPIGEQESISAALSDIDTLLSDFKSIISKKRNIKQATMQELLTGKRRLPGFEGEWEVKRLGDIAEIDPESIGAGTPPNFHFNYISLEDVEHGNLRSCSEQVFASAPSRARRRLRRNDVLVSTVRPNLLSHLLFGESGGKWVASTGFSVARCKPGMACPGYVFAHLFAEGVNRQIEALLTGSNYPAINSKDVRALEIPLPPYPEQCAIAAVLSDIDTELSALEARRDKTRDLKQGMMQELLTGRTRLT